MVEVFLAIGIMLLIMAGMAVGVIFSNKPIKGSCGGVGAALGKKNYNCDICGGDPDKCEESPDDDFAVNKDDSKALAYDAFSDNSKKQRDWIRG